MAPLQAAAAAVGKLEKEVAKAAKTEGAGASAASRLKTATQQLGAAAGLATKLSKAEAAAWRANTAAEVAAAAAARRVIAEERAAAAALGTSTAALRNNATASRADAASEAALAAGLRTVIAATGVETAASRRLSAAFNAEAAGSRAAAAALRVQILQAQIQAAAFQRLVGAAKAVGNALRAVGGAAKAMAGAIAGAGGAIPPLVRGLASLGSAGLSGARRAGQAIQQFIVAAAQRGVGAVNRLAGSLKSMGSGAFGALRGAATAFGLVTTVFGITAIKNAVAFQEQMATVNTILGYVGDKATLLDNLGRSIRNLAVDQGIPIADLTSAMYELASAGVTVGDQFGTEVISAEDLLIERTKVLTATAHLAVGGIATMTEATKLMSFALNAFGLNQPFTVVGGEVAKAAGIMGGSIGEVSTQIADYFAKAVEIGVVKASEIASTFANVAATAKFAGIGIDEIAASYAQQTRRGVSAAKVANSMQRALQDLIQPGKALKELQSKTGIDFLKLAGQQGLVKTLQLMRDLTGADDKAYRALFKRQEGFRFAVNSTGKDLEDYNKTLLAVQESTKDKLTIDGKTFIGTAAIQAAIRGDTVSRNIIRLQESFKSLGITIGYYFLAPVNSMIKAITNVLTITDRWLDGLTNGEKAMARQAATLIGIVGAILALGAGLQGFLLIGARVAPMFGATATGARALQQGLKFLVFPVALLVAAIGGLVFAIENNIAGFGKYAAGLRGMQALVAGVFEVFGAFGKVLGDVFRAMKTGADAGKVLTSGLADVGKMLENLGPLASLVGSFLVEMFVKISGGLVEALGEVLPQLATWAFGVGETILKGVASVIPSLLRWAGDIVETVVPALIRAGRQMFTWLGEVAQDIGPYLVAIVEIFVEWAGNVANAVIPRLVRFGQEIINWLGSVAVAIGPAVLQLLGALIGWAVGIAQKVIPVLVRAGQDIVGWVVGLGRQIAPVAVVLGHVLIGWISDAVPKAVAALGRFFDEVVQNVSGAVPAVTNAALGLAGALGGWVGDALPVVIGALGDLLTSVVSWIQGVAPAIATAVGAWVGALGKWVGEAGPGIFAQINDLIDGIVGWLQNTEALRKIVEAGAGLLLALAAGIALFIAKTGPEIAVQIIGGIGNAIVDHLPMIVGAALFIAGTFVKSLINAIMRDPVAFAKGVLVLMTAASVLGAVLSAAGTAGTLYAQKIGSAGLITRALVSIWSRVSYALEPIITAAGLLAGRIYAKAVVVGRYLFAFIGSLWGSLTGAIAGKIAAAGLAQGGIMGRFIGQGTLIGGWIQRLFPAIAVGATPGAALAGTELGLTMGKAAALAALLTPIVLLASVAWGVKGDSPSGESQFGPKGRIFDLQRRIDALSRQDPTSLAFPGSTTNTATAGQEITRLKAEVTGLEKQLAAGPAGSASPDWIAKLRGSKDRFDQAAWQRQLDDLLGGGGGDNTPIAESLITRIEAAKATIKQDYADLATTVIDGDQALNDTVAALDKYIPVSTSDQLKALQIKRTNIASLLHAEEIKPKNEQDVKYILSLRTALSGLTTDINTTKATYDNLPDIIKNLPPPATTAAIIEAHKNELDVETSALRESARILLALKEGRYTDLNPPTPPKPPPTPPTGLPPSWIVPAPTIDQPSLTDLIAIYGQIPSKLHAAYELGAGITPTPEAPIPTFNGTKVTELVTKVQGIKTTVTPFVDQLKNLLTGPGILSSMITGGAAVLQAFIDGLNSKKGLLSQTSSDLANVPTQYMHGQSPPPVGPLSHIDEGGANVVSAWLGGMMQQVQQARNTGVAVAQAFSGGTKDAVIMTGRMAYGQTAGVGASGSEAIVPMDRTEQLLERQIANSDLHNRLLGRLAAHGERGNDSLVGNGIIAGLRQRSIGAHA